MFPKALAILLAVPFIVQFASAQSCSRTYTVQPGDVCDGISAANSVSTYQLAVVNEGVIDENCSNLNPGTVICLGWVGEDCTTTYPVKLGDTCDAVAYAHGINTTTLYNNNPQLDSECSNLYVGEVVCTSSTVEVPPLPSGSILPGSVIPPTATPAPTSTDIPWCD